MCWPKLSFNYIMWKSWEMFSNNDAYCSLVFRLLYIIFSLSLYFWQKNKKIGQHTHTSHRHSKHVVGVNLKVKNIMRKYSLGGKLDLFSSEADETWRTIRRIWRKSNREIKTNVMVLKNFSLHKGSLRSLYRLSSLSHTLSISLSLFSICVEKLF